MIALARSSWSRDTANSPRVASSDCWSERMSPGAAGGGGPPRSAAPAGRAPPPPPPPPQTPRRGGVPPPPPLLGFVWLCPSRADEPPADEPRPPTPPPPRLAGPGGNPPRRPRASPPPPRRGGGERVCPRRPQGGPAPPHRHAKASFQLRQLIRQYGRHELRVHVPLRQLPRVERVGDRLHRSGRVAAGPRLRPQLLQQPVEHRSESAARLEWRLAQRESVTLDGTARHCSQERLRWLPRSAGTLPTCKELAYASVRRGNSFCNIALRL